MESKTQATAVGEVNALDERAMLLLLTDAVEIGHGTEDFGLFLYSLVRMHVPETIVELGTALGAPTFWMALAAKKNKTGHVWTVDDFEFFEKRKPLVERAIANLREANVISIENANAEE